MTNTGRDLHAEFANLKSEVEELAQVVEDLRGEMAANKESIGTLSHWIEKLGKLLGAKE